MPQDKIDRLIINSPYEEPKEYWQYDRTVRKFERKQGRRPAGYIVATPGTRGFDDPGIFHELGVVNKIRPKIAAWREAQYPGTTSITRRLLGHWYDLEERSEKRFFFCQLEAIETLIWLVESPISDRVGIELGSDGGDFKRICAKMATGSGKTIVMAMLIAWQALNKVTYPKDSRFSKDIYMVAPGLTVKSRLQVLLPDSEGNYYDEFNIVPVALKEKLREARVVVENWHTLSWETDDQIAKRKSVDKRGALSDEAYVRQVLGDLADSNNILVINDEAHHAWRVQPELKEKREFAEQVNEATVWVSGLDRIHKARNILTCYDFSATPFAPTGKKNNEEALFGWIVSDFGLNDAIEAGLVKTPRVVVRDDGRLTKEYKSRLYHIYQDEEVKDDITRRGAQESEPLPDLVKNAYILLGADWLETHEYWKEKGKKVPPVMITVANLVTTAARIKHAFDHNEIPIRELCEQEYTLQIDSKVLDDAESQTEAIEVNATDGMTKAEQGEYLRRIVDTVGKVGEPGEQMRHIISVGMLSEGWDAKTVTHIMGLRAFTSQLLCEQVVGRGLRRTSYDVNEETQLFEPEYVNIFGVPFTFLPHEETDEAQPQPPKPQTQIEPVDEKKQYELSWPNVIRVDRVYDANLRIDINSVSPIELDPNENITSAEMAAIIAGKPNVAVMTEIDLEKAAEQFRLQTLVFEVAKQIFNVEEKQFKGNKDKLLMQLIKIVDEFINSNKIVVRGGGEIDGLRKRVLILVNMNKIVQHIWQEVKAENTQKLVPVYDPARPIMSTGDMRTWYTTKPCEYAKKSHISFTVFDSTWEASEAYVFDRNAKVEAWAKNDHLGFEIVYTYGGVIRKFRPDFIIKLTNGKFLVLEVKGKDTPQNRTKREFLAEWVKAVNEDGRFGEWEWDVSFNPNDIEGILHKHTL